MNMKQQNQSRELNLQHLALELLMVKAISEAFMMPLPSFITSAFLQVANCSGSCCYCNTPTKSIRQGTRT
jgi:hypothetical protein